MHPLLRLPYASLLRAARLAAALPLPGESKVARGLRARRDVVERIEAWARAHRDLSRPLIWIHAPSVGEGLQARPVLERLRARHPELQIVYTHFSPSAERFAATLGADLADYLPFDDGAQMRRVLDALRPRALVFSKLDVWPRLSEEAAARGVRLGLISATMSASSGRRGALARALSYDALASLDLVGAIDPADAERLVSAGVRAERIRLTGDTRYDQVVARAAAVDRDSPLLAPLFADRPTLVAGSTWPADERVLFPAWQKLLGEITSARLIIAPHEPTREHLEPVRDWAALSGFSLAALDEPDVEVADVVLIDRVGVLGDIYALGNAAYVGGAFHAAGLHSVLEPAAFGMPVIFGPHHQASRDARLLLECHGAASVSDIPTMLDALRIALGEPDTNSAAGTAAKTMVTAGLGAADRSTKLVEDLLDLV